MAGSITQIQFVVTVVDRSSVVEHLPYNIAPTVLHFLKRSVNKGLVEVTRASQLRGRLWPGNALQVQTVRFEGIHREAQGTY